MNRFALLSLYRSLTRHKLYAALNIGGLAVGIAVFLVLGLYVRFETSYEKWLPDHDKIYLVETVWKIPGSPFNGPSSETMGGLLDQIREDFPGVVGTRLSGGEGGGSVLRNGVATREDVAQVDPGFFDVFDLAMVRGNGQQGLSTPTGTLISETLAKKYFGSSDPIGQSMTIVGEAPAQYRVTGIFRDLPANTEQKFTILIPLPRTGRPQQWTHWGSTSLTTYLRFDTPARARAFEQKMPAFVERRAGGDMGPRSSRSIGIALAPLTQTHLSPNVGGGAKLTVVTLGLVGVLTLLIAVVNYVNLATARAGL
ncbi:MAG: transporter, partial [Sphingomonas sp.]